MTCSTSWHGCANAVLRRLPVTRPDGALIGVIALDNLLEALAEQLDGMIGVLKAQQTRELRTRP